jgi:hypothetical protein
MSRGTEDFFMPNLQSHEELQASIRAYEEPYQEYWYHLGRFLHAFAAAEAQLLFLLREISGMTKAKAGVVFNGTRSEAARELINKFLDATKEIDKKERLSGPFAQMAAIGTVRNNLVHWGAKTDGVKDFTISNLDRNPINPREYTVSVKDLTNMVEDLSVIIACLYLERKVVSRLRPSPHAPWPFPWRYIPPQPSPHMSKKGQGPTKRRPPPFSSPS